MKIVFMFYDTNNYNGGPAVNAIRLLPELKKRGHEIIGLVGYRGTGYPNAQYLIGKGIHCITYLKPRYSDDEVKFVLRQVKKIKPDVFVSNISTAGAFAGRWIQQWDIPVIHTHRGDNKLNNGTAEFFFKGPKKWRLSALVCVNKFLLDQLKSNDDFDFRTEIIPSGVPISTFNADQKANEKIKIVYSGRIVQLQKRVLDMVDAFIALARKWKNLEFTIIGDGDAEFVETVKSKIADENVSERFLFLGRLEGDIYKNELAKNHIIVLLSDFEGIPGAVMDGMECGLVPVVLNVNGVDELVVHMHNGLLVNNRTNEFYDAIELLMVNGKLREELAGNARATISRTFSLDRAADKWLNLFAELSSSSVRKKRMRMPFLLGLPGKHELLVQHTPKALASRVLNRLRKAIHTLKGG